MEHPEKGLETNQEGYSQHELDDRREFFKKCGKFALYTAPAITALLLFDKKSASAAQSVL